MLEQGDNNFILYKSNNLLDWEEIQRVPIKGDYECPDIYKIKVEENNDKLLNEFIVKIKKDLLKPIICIEYDRIPYIYRSK